MRFPMHSGMWLMCGDAHEYTKHYNVIGSPVTGKILTLIHTPVNIPRFVLFFFSLHIPFSIISIIQSNRFNKLSSLPSANVYRLPQCSVYSSRPCIEHLDSIALSLCCFTYPLHICSDQTQCRSGCFDLGTWKRICEREWNNADWMESWCPCSLWARQADRQAGSTPSGQALAWVLHQRAAPSSW